METAAWTEKRFAKLFERYNRKYWRGRLPDYRVVPATLDCLGRCHSGKERLIEIDVKEHKNDRHVRATLLHEMVHAATGSGHDVKFFAQMERLYVRGALAGVEAGDAGDVRTYHDLVPRRFRLLRKKMERLEKQRAREIDRWAAKHNLPIEEISDEQIVAKFAEPELAAMRWTHARVAIGIEYQLSDEVGRPRNSWARRILASGKKTHDAARRDHLANERYWERFNQSAK